MTALTPFVRRHVWFLALLALGVAMRLIYMRGYITAFVADPDSKQYLWAAVEGAPDPVRPFGYSAFLALLSPLDSLRAVMVIQHALGLATGIAAYAFLRHRGVAAWLAAVGAAPLLLDAWQLALEHYIMSDTLFTALICAAFFTLLWRDRPGPVVCAISGALFGAAALTRLVGVPVIVVVVLYLIVRRMGWRPAGALVGTFVIMVGSCAIWVRNVEPLWGPVPTAGRQYYGRAAQIADCDGLSNLTDRERLLCPVEPLHQRKAADFYGNFPESPSTYFAADDPVFGSFTAKVFAAQPGDLALLVGRDAISFFRTTAPSERHLCFEHMWVPRSKAAPLYWCFPHLPDRDDYITGVEFNAMGQTRPRQYDWGWSRAIITGYSAVMRTPPWLLFAAVLVTAFAAFRSRRDGRPGRRDGPDSLLLASSGLGLVLAAVVGAMFDVRYGIPAAALISVGGALAVQALRRSRTAAPSVVSVKIEKPLPEPAVSGPSIR